VSRKAGFHLPSPINALAQSKYSLKASFYGVRGSGVHVPLDCPPGPGPSSGASLGGPTMGQIGWDGPSTGPTLLFGAAGVSPCRCEPLRAGCCGGGGVRCFVG